MIAAWIPVTVVPTSSATVAIDTFMTDVSRIIRNWAAASVSSTDWAPLAVLGAEVAGAPLTPAPRDPRGLASSTPLRAPPASAR